MAPTSSLTLVYSSNPPSGRHFHHLHRQALNSFHHPPRQTSTSRTGQAKPRSLDTEPQPSAILEGSPPPLISPVPTESVAFSPESSGIPVEDDQPQGVNQQNIPGNIIVAVVVVVLILGGLIGLVVGGETLRRQAKATSETTPPGPSSRCFGRRGPKLTKHATRSTGQRIKTNREKCPYDEKMSSPVTRPPPVLNKERQRIFSDVWPVRSLSRVLCDRRSRLEQVEHGGQRPAPAASPQTTWSEFSTASFYAVSPRTVLSCIPEETEDCYSQSDIAVVLGVALQRPSDPSVPPKWSHSTRPADRKGSELVARRCSSDDCQNVCKAETGVEETKSLGSSAPDMTADGGESSRSSTASLESLEGESDEGSLKAEAFELRRAQTRSMQMNKGVLLSLGLKTLDVDDSNAGCGPSRPPLATNTVESGKDCIEPEMSLAMLGGSFSAVNLDEFPSPPSVLPVIPSFVSGF